MLENKKKIDTIITNTRFIIFVIGVISLVGFLLSHNFLYGYYFGGINDLNITNFYVFSNYLPFKPLTITFTGTIFFGLSYMVFSTISLYLQPNSKSQSMLSKFFLIIVIWASILVVLILTFSSLSLDNALGNGIHLIVFSLFFFYIFSLLILLFSSLIGFYSTFLISILSGIFSYIFINRYSSFEDFYILMISMGIVFIHSVTVAILITSKNEKKDNIFIYQLWYLIFLSLIAFFNSIFNKLPIIPYVPLYLMFILLIGLLIIYWKKINIKLNGNQIKDSFKSFFDSHNKNGFIYTLMMFSSNIFKDGIGSGAKIIISFSLLLIILIVSQFSLVFGSTLRSVNDDTAPKLCIKYRDEDNIQSELISNFNIINGNQIIYSNSKWEHAMINSDNYTINHVKENEDCVKNE